MQSVGSPTSSSAKSDTTRQDADEDVGDPAISASTKHKFWHSRGYLPHCDTPGLLQVITFRLNDSIPSQALHRLMQENEGKTEKLRQIERLLDAGTASVG